MLPGLVRLMGALVLWVLALLASAAMLAPRVDWQPPIEIATGGGTKGAWRQNESDYDYVDDGTVAYLADGRLALAWVDQRSKDVLFQTRGGDGKVATATVNASRNGATFSWHPRIAASPGADRAVYLLWQEIIFSGGSHGGDILFARSLDGGRSFGAPVNLSSSIGGDGKGRVSSKIWSNGSLDLAVAANGTVYAAWTEYDGALWLIRSVDAGASFSRPARIAGDARLPARGPSLATGRADAVWLAWTVGEDDDADIRVAVSTDAGRSFGQPRLIGVKDAYADAPRLAIGHDGSVHLVYAERPDRMSDASKVKYARADAGSDSFDAPRTISMPVAAGYPALATDANGRVHVLWELFPRPDARPRGLGFAVSSDRGLTFGPSRLVPGSEDPAGVNGSHQGLLGKKLAVGKDGAITVINSSLGFGQASRIWLIQGLR
ncbi:sialidase family protein [Massilia niastensis]|uniref:sialidase family protein n=1 Tax=Massilia niastensis TaxID=544911 RepID=UPI0003A88107|nr:sialidase family protein [Massilia niastensis]